VYFTNTGFLYITVVFFEAAIIGKILVPDRRGGAKLYTDSHIGL